MKNTIKLTKRHARKIVGLVDQGLVRGMGDPVPGKMCVEAAVCFALGLPHGDNPPCVGRAVRAFKIRLNDASRWSSNMTRGRGMRRLAIAQLGSDTIDQLDFAKRLLLEIIRQLLPPILRRRKMEAQAVACESATTLEEARVAAKAAAAYAAEAEAAEMAVQILVAMKCPGCRWLDLAPL